MVMPPDVRARSEPRPAQAGSSTAPRSPADSILAWAHTSGIADFFSFPSAAVDRTLEDVAVRSDSRVALRIAASERSAAVAAEAMSVVAGRPVGVLMDSHWRPDIRPCLLEDAVVHLALVSADWPDDWVTEPLTSEGVTGPPVAESVPRRRSTHEVPPTAIVLPPPHHPQRAASLMVALTSQMPVITCSGIDPFPQDHPDRWVGRFGFLPSPHLLEAATHEPDGVWFGLLPGARAPEWAHPVAFPVDPAALPRTSMGAIAGRTRSRPVSPLARTVRAILDCMPEALTIADAGASHRVVAEQVANAGFRALLPDGLIPMGWSLAAALGAAAAVPDMPLLVVVGDGSALEGLADLAVLARARVPVVVVLARNGTLGNRSGRLGGGGGPEVSLPGVDWLGLGRALGIPAREVDASDPSAIAAWAQRHLAGGEPCLVVVDTPPSHPADLSHRTGIPHVDALFHRDGAAVDGRDG